MAIYKLLSIDFKE